MGAHGGTGGTTEEKQRCREEQVDSSGEPGLIAGIPVPCARMGNEETTEDTESTESREGGRTRVWASVSVGGWRVTWVRIADWGRNPWFWGGVTERYKVA